MIYILHIGFMSVWVGWLLKSRRLTWVAFVNIFVLALLVVDILSDPVRDNFLGILFTDSAILPLTAFVIMLRIILGKQLLDH